MTKRKTYIEVLRIIACLFVLAIHTAVSSEYQNDSVGSVAYRIDLFISIFIRCAVPIFFMISGVTLLDKKESIIKIWKDRIFRTFIVLFSFSLFYFLCD